MLYDTFDFQLTFIRNGKFPSFQIAGRHCRYELRQTKFPRFIVIVVTITPKKSSSLSSTGQPSFVVVMSRRNPRRKRVGRYRPFPFYLLSWIFFPTRCSFTISKSSFLSRGRTKNRNLDGERANNDGEKTKETEARERPNGTTMAWRCGGWNREMRESFLK